MTRLLRFLFARRFNRLNTLNMAVASGFGAQSHMSTAILILLVGGFLSALGEVALERRQ